MRTTFEGLLPANNYAEENSRKLRVELFVVKENSGGIRYTVTDNVVEGQKKLSRYRFGHNIALDAPDLVFAVPKPFVPAPVEEKKVEDVTAKVEPEKVEAKEEKPSKKEKTDK